MRNCRFWTGKTSQISKFSSKSKKSQNFGKYNPKMTKNSSKLSKNAVKSKNKKLNWKFKKCAKVGFGLVKRVKFQNFHKNEKKTQNHGK